MGFKYLVHEESSSFYVEYHLPSYIKYSIINEAYTTTDLSLKTYLVDSTHKMFPNQKNVFITNY